ncbi:hypothetical protein A2662_01395 [Candidatus Giovannonibacteria bacterium RIFCSPHIGHO2_01_FULL_45_33]|uniref:Uncharacterized protein n=1 Tax=Candidatus Giovannonibacteria bacterium RIFCSPLOWO2_01_FULL_45_34 TaxID=1798351 RepID=A0A1F5WZV3_9BACT|nr:MAG: hypothetical protein A2662_01395 [Candidatus Giovannonibacteria bacterium RIFCSPHIGHO2_01_FULL_45_33]OGF69687.1 MAG: hypothetical protein A3C73_00095 [Candidatus Giovannonibacteria bacterium RIFCSPHIGHO2_02_FULL_44_11]OGF81149.1 MAG: hypothetical protein A2930_01110 [Candidatus Giovannonibacteria bacterium RIFCSPLOWO2_01_FULL_45_34]
MFQITIFDRDGKIFEKMELKNDDRFNYDRDETHTRIFGYDLQDKEVHYLISHNHTVLIKEI